MNSSSNYKVLSSLEKYEPVYHPNYRLNSNLLFFYKDNFSIK